MELWIRSQNKKTLTKINNIGIEYDKEIIGYGNICTKLGVYETEERALEVLDEIQKCLTGTGYIEKCADITHIYPIIMFNMPEE